MARATVTVDGYTYEGRWLRANPSALHVTGPLEYQRPTHGSYSVMLADWADDAGPQGRCSPRHYRWWRAARLLLDQFLHATEQHHTEEDT